MSKDSDFYAKLRLTLEETTTFPTDYMYKFIIPTSKNSFTTIEKTFDNLGAVIKTKQSKNGKYTSLTVYVKMKSVEEIIDKYKEVSKVKGLISL